MLGKRPRWALRLSLGAVDRWRRLVVTSARRFIFVSCFDIYAGLTGLEIFCLSGGSVVLQFPTFDWDLGSSFECGGVRRCLTVISGLHLHTRDGIFPGR